MNEVVRISPSEAHEKMESEGFIYVDVRTTEEFGDGHPIGAINVPLDDRFVPAIAKRFGKGAKLVIGCKTGVRSLRAARALVEAGFTRVLEQRAGFDGARSPFGELLEPGWSRQGLPSEP